MIKSCAIDVGEGAVRVCVVDGVVRIVVVGVSVPVVCIVVGSDEGCDK